LRNYRSRIFYVTVTSKDIEYLSEYQQEVARNNSPIDFPFPFVYIVANYVTSASLESSLNQ